VASGDDDELAVKAGTFRSAWRNRRWRAFIAGTSISTAGDFVYLVALVVYLIEETGSAGWVAAAATARMATFTLLGPIGGAIADRFDRRRLMVLLDLARAAVMVIVAFVIAVDVHVLVVVGLVVVATALTTPYRPAAVAATPLLVPESDLAAANAAEATIGQLAWFVGPAVGAALVSWAGPEPAFVINGVTFGVSALFVGRIGDIGRGARVTADDAGEKTPSIARQIVGGAKAIRSTDGLVAMSGLLVAMMFAYGIENVVHVLVVRDRLGLDAGGVGVLSASLGVGGLAAAPFAARVARSGRSGALLAGAGILMGAPLALLAVGTSPVIASVLMVIEGAGNILLDVLFITLLQRLCAEEVMGRVFALQDTGAALAQLLGIMSAPLLVTHLGLRGTLVVGGGALVVTAIVLLPRLAAVSGRLEADRLVIAPLVERLAAVPIFADAAPPALERIARRAEVRRYEPGDVIVAEGDAAIEVFVLHDGEVVVSTGADGEIGRIGAGDWFGEIGVLRQVPRTATVTAATDVEVSAIPGAVFVGALNGSDGLPDPLARTMNMRLMRTQPDLLSEAATREV
jgi:MFS family permease